MIDIAELEQYFPNSNNLISEGQFRFRLSISQETEEDIFIINLKIKQEDTKEGHLIKFKLGLGKDKKTRSETHESHKPHFEIEIYKREEDSFSANIYFTFDTESDKELLEYAKGTVVIISRIIQKFLKNHSLNPKIINSLVYSEEVEDELSKYEHILITALYDCYKNSNLIVRQKGEVLIIKTTHNLDKYLNVADLEPLYLPLFEKAKNK